MKEQPVGPAYWAAWTSVALGITSLAFAILPVTKTLSYLPAYVGLFLGVTAAAVAAARRENGAVEAVAGCTFCSLRLMIAGYFLILSGQTPTWFYHW
jgi:hypothetical protein